MTDWLFQYEDLISTMDDYALSTESVEYQKAWSYTKHMMKAHAFAIRPEGVTDKEALSVAWAQFESTFDEDEEQALLPLAGIIANLVNCIPFGEGAKFHEAIEVGFARARGFSKEEATLQHQEWMAANPDTWNDYTDEAPIERRKPRPNLQLIEGGKGK